MFGRNGQTMKITVEKFRYCFSLSRRLGRLNVLWIVCEQGEIMLLLGLTFFFRTLRRWWRWELSEEEAFTSQVFRVGWRWWWCEIMTGITSDKLTTKWHKRTEKVFSLSSCLVTVGGCFPPWARCFPTKFITVEWCRFVILIIVDYCLVRKMVLAVFWCVGEEGERWKINWIN